MTYPELRPEMNSCMVSMSSIHHQGHCVQKSLFGNVINKSEK